MEQARLIVQLVHLFSRAPLALLAAAVAVRIFFFALGTPCRFSNLSRVYHILTGPVAWCGLYRGLISGGHGGKGGIDE